MSIIALYKNVLHVFGKIRKLMYFLLTLLLQCLSYHPPLLSKHSKVSIKNTKDIDNIPLVKSIKLCSIVVIIVLR